LGEGVWAWEQAGKIPNTANKMVNALFMNAVISLQVLPGMKNNALILVAAHL
jgi:hypothetical protein